jgi:hypothetical protein
MFVGDFVVFFWAGDGAVIDPGDGLGGVHNL